MSPAIVLRIVTVAVAVAAPLNAGTPQTWSASSAEALSPGTFDGTALEPDGTLILAPEVRTLWGPEPGIVWSIAEDGADGAFVALSAPGRVLRVSSAGVDTWHTATEERLVTAVIGDGRGGVYFGTSPDGRLHHARAARELAAPIETGAMFIWALARSDDGSVWVGTGSPGRVLRLRQKGGIEVIFDAQDDPVRVIVPHRDGGVLVGTGGRGRLVRIGADSRPFVIFDAEEEEIVGIATARDGRVFALASRGSRGISSGRSMELPPGPVETVRVVAAAPATPEPGIAPPDPEPTPQVGASAARPRLQAPAGVRLYAIAADGSHTSLWESRDDVPFALALDASERPIVATGEGGRVYHIDREGRSGVLLRLPSEQVSALHMGSDGRLWIGGTRDARVTRLEPVERRAGSYLTPPIDAGGVARWGRLTWQVELPPRTRLIAWVRSGNSAEPDATWTDWRQVPPSGGALALTGLPPSRWAQARFDFEAGEADRSPRLDRINVQYARQNRPPRITSLQLDPPGVTWSRMPAPSTRQAPVADDPLARRATQSAEGPGRAAAPVRKGYEVGVRAVSWQAEDPDSDRLLYAMEIRRQGGEAWLPLADDIREEFLTWDTRVVPDGQYRLRLTASDALDNPDQAVLIGERVSDVFDIDNTRPVVLAPRIVRRDGRLQVHFETTDVGGQIAAAEVAMDGGPWWPLAPEDGIADSARESYVWSIEEAKAPRALRLRITDAMGNVGGELWSLPDGP